MDFNRAVHVLQLNIIFIVHILCFRKISTTLIARKYILLKHREAFFFTITFGKIVDIYCLHVCICICMKAHWDIWSEHNMYITHEHSHFEHSTYISFHFLLNNPYYTLLTLGVKPPLPPPGGRGDEELARPLPGHLRLANP